MFYTEVHLQVDCTENSKLCSLWDISGYPTLKYLRDGSLLHHYTDKRELSSLRSFVDKTVAEVTQNDNLYAEDGMVDKTIQRNDFEVFTAFFSLLDNNVVTETYNCFDFPMATEGGTSTYTDIIQL